MTTILTRQHAIQFGMTKYFTGKPCKRGHISQRYTITSACTSCIASHQKINRQQLNTARSGVLQDSHVKSYPDNFELLQGIADVLHSWRNHPNYLDRLRKLGAYVQALSFD